MNDQHKHFVGEVAQKAIIENEGKVLFVRSLNAQQWDLPGGRLNLDESAVEGLMREVQEEVGLVVEIGRAVHMAPVHKPHWKHPRFFIFYEARLVSAASDLAIEEEEIREARWVPIEEVATLDTWEPWRRAVELYHVFKK